MTWWRTGWMVTMAVVVTSLGGPAAAQIDPLRPPAPAFPEADRLWRNGSPAEALRTLDRQLSPRPDEQPLEALALQATLSHAAGDPERSDALWRDVIRRAVFMRTYARRRLVESLAGRGQPRDAHAVLDELIADGGTRHIDLMRLVADAHQAAGDGDAARRLYRALIARQPRGGSADAARLGLAVSLGADGAPGEAAGAYRRARLEARTGDTYERATDAERRLVAETGATLPRLDEGEYRTLVRRLRARSRFAATLDLIDEWRRVHAAGGADEHIDAERVATLYAQRDNEAAVAACAHFYETHRGSPLVPEVRLTDFRLAVRMVDTGRARRTGLDLWEGRVPGASASQRRDAANLLAAYLGAIGDLDGALALYRQLFGQATSADDQRAYLWRAGVAAFRAGDRDRARANLRSLIDRDPSGDLLPAGLYWLARVEAVETPEIGTRRLRTIAERFPYHYYGMRAREILGLPEPTDANADRRFPVLTLDAATRERAEFRAATVLARAGLRVDAAWYLRRLSGRMTRDRGLALLAARASAEAGDHAAVTRLLVNHFAPYLYQPARDLPPDFWQLVYPRAFFEEVREAAERQGVDPYLLMALMRRESRFDPDARSAVGAIGLFQIMTYTAEALGASAGVGHVVEDGRANENTLAEPAVNAAIAARLVATIVELFGDATAPVAASYNAGEERVAIWWASSRDEGEDVFVDTIPYSETRRFVREILTNRAAYARLYREQR